MSAHRGTFRGHATGFIGPAVLLTLLLTAACAPSRDYSAGGVADFSKIQATEVFAAGYSGVSEKYIDRISVGEIAIEGIRGLAAIDPDLSVVREDLGQGPMVTLSAAGRRLVRLPAPGDDDVDGWANLTADISMAARNASEDLRAADMETIYEAVFDGVLSNLDIFSRYAGAEEARFNRGKREGFGGIGIRYRIKEGIPVLTDILPQTPAERAGLRKGDQLTHADGVALKNLDRREISKKLRGPTHTRIELTFVRPGQSEPMTVAMDRAHIFPVTITKKIDDGIVYLKLKSFNQDTARSLAEKLENASQTLGEDMKGLVLDLRGNPGGLLKQSVKVADLLLTQGRIISTRGRHEDSIHRYEAGGRDLAHGLPVVVLVDGKSASAAEIVAAALQDRDRAVVIGTSSFGKGSVQTVLRLPNDGEITLTWSRLVAPSGYIFHGLGIRPVICTSGAKEAAQEVIRKALNNRSETEATFVAWRKPGLQDEDKRARLRASCPSRRRTDDLDNQIARQLINNPALYARALTITSVTHEARY